jgi:hypothetical protein
MVLMFDALAKLEEYGRVWTPNTVTLHESRGKTTVVFEYGETGRANVDVTKADLTQHVSRVSWITTA